MDPDVNKKREKKPGALVRSARLKEGGRQRKCLFGGASLSAVTYYNGTFCQFHPLIIDDLYQVEGAGVLEVNCGDFAVVIIGTSIYFAPVTIPNYVTT